MRTLMRPQGTSDLLVELNIQDERVILAIVGKQFLPPSASPSHAHSRLF